MTNSYKIVYNVDYDANLCVNFAYLNGICVTNRRKKKWRESDYVKNIPAQKASEKEGARLPQAYEDCKRKKGIKEKACKGKRKTYLLIFSFSHLTDLMHCITQIKHSACFVCVYFKSILFNTENHLMNAG